MGRLRQRPGSVLAGVLITIGLLAAAGCSDGPGISVDVKALGDSPLARHLSRQWMNPEAALAGDLREWLHTRPDSTACLASDACLRGLGFHQCNGGEHQLDCRYQATLHGLLVKRGGDRTPLQVQLRISLQSRNGAITALHVHRIGL
jgi:hypothetical protein